jgi:hypothetical protein
MRPKGYADLTGATEHGAKNPEIGDILNKVVATKCCVRRGSANR